PPSLWLIFFLFSFHSGIGFWTCFAASLSQRLNPRQCSLVNRFGFKILLDPLVRNSLTVVLNTFLSSSASSEVQDSEIQLPSYHLACPDVAIEDWSSLADNHFMSTVFLSSAQVQSLPPGPGSALSALAETSAQSLTDNIIPSSSSDAILFVAPVTQHPPFKVYVDPNSDLEAGPAPLQRSDSLFSIPNYAAGVISYLGDLPLLSSSTVLSNKSALLPQFSSTPPRPASCFNITESHPSYDLDMSFPTKSLDSYFGAGFTSFGSQEQRPTASTEYDTEPVRRSGKSILTFASNPEIPAMPGLASRDLSNPNITLELQLACRDLEAWTDEQLWKMLSG
ncbi:hypothetical protein C8J56DRAFT_1097895, partial [Mycena floridula]